SSRTWSASWIADSAASVGSLIFFGVLAMSVVASLLRWTTITAESSAAPGARDHRDPHRIPQPGRAPKKGPQTLIPRAARWKLIGLGERMKPPRDSFFNHR